jgi:flagellar basal body-associated protein FliL
VQPYGAPSDLQPYAPAYPAPASGSGYWPAAPTATPAPPAPKKKRRYGLIITLVLVVLVVLCGGVGTAAYVVSTRQTGTGSDTPVDAANGFLTAIYQHQNATAAADFVCKQANDASALKKKVAEVTKTTDALDDPTYSWSTLQVGSQSTKEATVTTDLTISTDDEKRATQHLQILTINANGWWVCDVKASAK